MKQAPRAFCRIITKPSLRPTDVKYWHRSCPLSYSAEPERAGHLCRPAQGKGVAARCLLIVEEPLLASSSIAMMPTGRLRTYVTRASVMKILATPCAAVTRLTQRPTYRA